MTRQILIIEVAVGYMLKVLKSGRQITHFKREFGHIRHGNYLDFINLINGPLPFLVSYKDGVISSDNDPTKTDCDFELLYKSGPSLKLFYKNCAAIYGEIEDTDLTDDVFLQAVLFEIALRMHANNFNLLKEREDLVDVIDKLCRHKDIPQSEIDVIQKGRSFINMIKHYKGQFTTWKDGLLAFNMAFGTLEKYQLTIL